MFDYLSKSSPQKQRQWTKTDNDDHRKMLKRQMDNKAKEFQNKKYEQRRGKPRNEWENVLTRTKKKR